MLEEQLEDIEYNNRVIDAIHKLIDIMDTNYISMLQKQIISEKISKLLSLI